MLTLKSYFSGIYSQNSFNGIQSKSGPGSELDQTSVIRNQLPSLIKRLGIESFCDVPCGDFNWMQHVDLGNVNYFGFDIASDLVNNLRVNFQSEKRQFAELNIVEDKLESYDLIFCRDLLVHLNFLDAQRVIANIRSSGSKYLLTTTFTERKKNKNISYNEKKIGWYAINLELPPFNFGNPIETINENCTERSGNFQDKSLALYEIKTI
jgi:hypothetical protein